MPRVLALVALLLLPIAARADDDPLEKGRSLLGGPDEAEGLALLRKVVEDLRGAPADAGRQQRLGRAHFYLGEDAEAVAAFERAEALAPKDATNPYWLGVVWSYSDLDKSVVALERALKQDPKLGKAWYELGEVRSRRKEAEAALAAFLRAVALLPDDANVRYKAGAALQTANRPEEAVPHYERALALRPSFVNAGYNLGLLQYLAGHFEKARDAWVAVAPHAPDDLSLHAKVVQALFALGRYDEAGAWRAKVRKIHEAAANEEARTAIEFCIDQFKVDGDRVFAYERFPKPGPIEFPYVFRVSREGEETRRIQLEKSAVVEELGGPPFVLCAQEGDTHTTYDRAWRTVPPYPELRVAVIAALRGEVPVGARSTRTQGGSTIEVAK